MEIDLGFVWDEGKERQVLKYPIVYYLLGYSELAFPVPLTNTWA